MGSCCNCSLQTGTKVIAILEMLFSILGVLIFVFGGGLTAPGLKVESDEEIKSYPQDKETAAATEVIFRIFTIIVIVVAILEILLAVLLLVGAIKRSRKLCMLWFIVNLILLIVGVLEMLWNITSGDMTRRGPGLLGMLLRTYFLWVVWDFMSELKDEALVSPNSHPKPSV